MLYKFTGFRNFFFNFEFTGLVELLELEKKFYLHPTETSKFLTGQHFVFTSIQGIQNYI